MRAPRFVLRLTRIIQLAQVLVGRSSIRSVYRLRRAVRAPSYDRAPQAVSVRALFGNAVWVRPGTSDLTTLIETFWGRYHLPPPGVDLGRVRTIWDLGSNVGYTVAHLAALCPTARVLGIELDADNADMARANTRPWAARTEIVQAAVWISEGRLPYQRRVGLEYAFRLTEPGTADSAGPSAPAVSLNTLLARENPDRIDYVKMDIEGAELRVLREQTEWMERVETIKVEVHEPYSVDECVADLRRLGFQTGLETKHAACVIGTRRPTPATA